MPVYGSGCFRGSGGDGMIARRWHYKQQGYKAIKMQMAHTTDLRGDIDNVKRMREALGPDIAIMIDINQGWTADVAINQGRKITDYDIYWLEEPVPGRRLQGLPARRRGAADPTLSGGETHFTRYDLRPFFEKPVLSDFAARSDARRLYGFAQDLGARRHLGPANGASFVPRAERAVAASIPNGAWIEDMGLSEGTSWVEPVKVINGTITAPERPGHDWRSSRKFCRTVSLMRRYSVHEVIAGLDPAIQLFTKRMDARVTPLRGGPGMTNDRPAS